MKPAVRAVSHVRKFSPSGVLALLALMLAGCTSLAPSPKQAELAERTLQTAFELQGRIALSDGSRASNGSLLWQHHEHSDQLQLFTPLGQLAAQLTADAEGAQLLFGNGQRLRAPSTAELLPSLLGVPFPIDGLHYWIQAVPATSARIARQDSIGRPARIIDQGWIIEYDKFVDDSPTAIAQRINAERGETRIRLIIDQWTPLP